MAPPILCLRLVIKSCAPHQGRQRESVTNHVPIYNSMRHKSHGSQIPNKPMGDSGSRPASISMALLPPKSSGAIRATPYFINAKIELRLSCLCCALRIIHAASTPSGMAPHGQMTRHQPLCLVSINLSFSCVRLCTLHGKKSHQRCTKYAHRMHQ